MISEESSGDEIIEGDEIPEEEVIPNVSYDVTSYGSDSEVETLISRLRKGNIIVPRFQRDYVWRQPEASKFVESLLLGLPVPQVFFATDPETNRQLIIDGQQRLKTLLFFYDGFFNPRPEETTQRVFRLVRVQAPFEGKTYKTLEENDRILLYQSIIHATTIKQTSPAGDDTSLYHIFERLNSGGRRLTAQEMRIALYHGQLMNLVKESNNHESWRNIFGIIHSRLKDQEIILRFFALVENYNMYQRTLSEFLNKYAAKNKNSSAEKLKYLLDIFKITIDMFHKSLGR